MNQDVEKFVPPQLKVSALLYCSYIVCLKANQLYAFYKLILLIISMNVELNPGPITSDQNLNTHVIFLSATRSVRNKLGCIYNIADDSVTDRYI